MKQKSKITLYACFAALVFIVSATSPVAASVLEVKYPGTLIIETIDKPETLDPGCSYETFGGGLVDGIYEFLITYGKEPKDLQPELASSWNVAADGLSINFSIEPGHFFVLPETGANTSIEVNAWIMKYSIDRTIIMADPDGYGWMMDMIIPGANHSIVNPKNASEMIAREMHQFDVNMSEVADYLAEGGIEVLDDWTLRVNLRFAYAAAVTIFAFNAGVAVNPKWIADNAPGTYTEYTGLDTAADNATAMVPLDLWFPTLAGDYTKLGFPVSHNENQSGVVPSTGVNSAYVHEEATFSASGSGPYYLIDSETTYGQKITLHKNLLWEGFLNGQGGDTWPNAPDKVLIKTVNEQNSRLLDVKAGECDFPGVGSTLADQIIDMAVFEDTGETIPIIPDVVVKQVPGLTVIFLGMNQKSVISEQYLLESTGSTWNASEWKPYEWSTAYLSDNRTIDNNPFSSYVFRKAFIQAFDTETYIQQVLNGFGIIPQGCIPEGLMGHRDDLIDGSIQPVYSPDVAKGTFEAIGWQGSISIFYNQGNQARRAAALLLESSIEGMGIGINIDIREISWPQYLKIYKNLPAFLIGWAPDYADPDNYVAPFYNSYFGPQLNYSNPLVDTMINDAAAEPDQAVREQAYFDIEGNATLDYPFVPLYQGYGLSVRRDWIQGDMESVWNPMRSLSQPWERLEKKELIKTTTEPDTTVDTTTTEPDTTEEPTDDGGPGFEFAAFLIAASLMAVYYRKRRR